MKLKIVVQKNSISELQKQFAIFYARTGYHDFLFRAIFLQRRNEMTYEQSNRRGTSVVTLIMLTAVLYLTVELVLALPRYSEQKAYLEVIKK